MGEKSPQRFDQQYKVPLLTLVLRWLFAPVPKSEEEGVGDERRFFGEKTSIQD